MVQFFVLLYCYIVTLVRLSLVTIKGYLLACLLALSLDVNTVIDGLSSRPTVL